VNVLDEDTFIEKIESIIERDFFPDLEKLKLQQAYYDALRNNDTESLRDLYLKYSSLLSRTNRQTAPSTPAFFDTPITKKKDKSELPYSNDEPPTSGEVNQVLNSDKKATTAGSLDKFLAENTSEDNISFEVIMNDADKKNKLKLHNTWLHDREKFLKQKQENSLMLDYGDKGPDDVSKALDSWTYTAKNTLMYIPEGVPLTDQEELEKVKHIRVINHSNTRFTPEMIKSLYKTSSSSATNTPSTGSQKINPTINVITKVGVDGKEAVSGDTPKVRGYSFVDASPSPMPGRSMGDESPMMTWGEIESTPFRLEGSMTPYFGKIPGAPEFRIPDVPEREKIALNLEEKANVARRKKKKEAWEHMQRLTSPSRNISSPYATSVGEKINSMSPAAQRLLSTKLNLKINDKNITTPSPSRCSSTKSITSSPSFLSLLSSPSIRYNSSSSSTSSSIDNLRSNLKRPNSSNSITDNLLKLPKNT